MEIIFKQSDYSLNFLENQLNLLFDYFNKCSRNINGQKKYYEGIIMGFLKSDDLEIVPDIWVPENTKKEEVCMISDKMMDLIKQKQKENFKIYHFHSHLSSLPFPSADDPYNCFESIGIVSLGNPKYNELRIFHSFDYSSYPPSLGNIKCGEKMSTLVRFDKIRKKVSFLPLEKEVIVKDISDFPFMRDW